MNNYNLEDLYKDPRMTRLTSDLNDANSKQEYNRAEQIEEQICRLSDHYKEQQKMNNQPIKTTEDGITEYRLNGELHREDGPAVDNGYGCEMWYLHGELHREDGPAQTMDNGDFWFLNGELHREDGPAIEWAAGHKECYLNGERHREDGPAVEWANGDKEWWLNNEEVNPETIVDLWLAKNIHCFYNAETDSLEFD